MAQTGGVGALNLDQNLGKLAYFVSINNARFRRPVVPGDTLRIEVELVKFKLSLMHVHAEAKVGDELAAEADLAFAFVRPKE
jgi:3-hydroxyacyl-[acyl-carrier-protein] dehydratase